MPYRFAPVHLAAFKSIPFAPQPPYGKAPTKWASMMGIEASAELPDFAKLPDAQLTRDQVREHCNEPYSLLHGYIVAMSWGDQGAGMGGTKHALSAWGSRSLISELLHELRTGKLSRREAYDLFASNPVKGLGPAYFSKLLMFFRSGADNGQPVDRYMLDKWTAKSVNLLTGEKVVRLNKDGNVEATNTGEHYEAFCAVIDSLAVVLNKKKSLGRKHSGEDVDQMLFSLGSVKKQPPHAWRAYVDERWAP